MALRPTEPLPRSRGARDPPRSCSPWAPCWWCPRARRWPRCRAAPPVRLLLLRARRHGPGFSWRAARAGLRSSEETPPHPLRASASPSTSVARCSRAIPDPGPPRRRLPRPAPVRADDRRLAAGLLGLPPSSRCCGHWTGCRTGCGPRLPLRRPRRPGHRPVRTAGGGAGRAADDGAVVARGVLWGPPTPGWTPAPNVARGGPDDHPAFGLLVARLGEAPSSAGTTRAVPVAPGLVAGAATTGAISSWAPGR